MSIFTDHSLHIWHATFEPGVQTTRNDKKANSQRKPKRAPARQLSLRTSSGYVKETVDIAKLLVMSGSSAVNVSGTKPTASIQNSNSSHNKKTPKAITSTPTSQGTTQNWYARYVGK